VPVNCITIFVFATTFVPDKTSPACIRPVGVGATVRVVALIEPEKVAAVDVAVAQPRRNIPLASGKLNVVLPSPEPYTVPIAVKSAA
jgi:hypothetical protein